MVSGLMISCYKLYMYRRYVSGNMFPIPVTWYLLFMLTQSSKHFQMILLAEQLFGLHNILTHRIVLELCLMVRKKINKVEIFMFGFSNLIKVSRTNIVDLALD